MANRDFQPKLPKFRVQMDTPDTTLLGLYLGSNGQCAIVGSVRAATGELGTDCISVTGQLWQALNEALTQAATIGNRNLFVATNTEQLTKPFWHDSPAWDCARLLGYTWGGHFRFVKSDNLPKAEQLYKEVYSE